MDILEVWEQVRALLQEKGRITYTSGIENTQATIELTSSNTASKINRSKEVENVLITHPVYILISFFPLSPQVLGGLGQAQWVSYPHGGW